MADINISLGLIDNSFKKAMKAINAEINDTNKTARELDKQFNNLDNSMENVAQQTEILRKKQDLLNEQYQSASNKVKLYQQQQEKAKDRIKEFRNEIEKLDPEAKDYEKNLERLNNAIKTHEQYTETMARKERLAKEEMESLSSESKQLENRIESLASEVKTTSNSFDVMQNTLKKIDFTAVGFAVENCGRAMYNFGSRIINGFINGLEEAKEFTAELETQQFLLEQLPSDIQNTIDKLGDISLNFGFTEKQGEKVATDLASFFQRSDILDKVDLSEVWERALDLSAMYDMDVDEVAERIKKIMLGNFENADGLGFNVNVASIEQFMGVKWDDLAYAEKMLVSLEYIMKQTEASTGRASQEAEQFAAQWNLAKTNIDEIKNTVLGYISEALLPLISKINEVISPIKDWISNNKELVTKIGLVVGVIGGFIGILGAVLIPLGLLVQILKPLSTLFGGLSTVIGAVCSPIGLVIVAIGLLVGALVYAYNNCESFRNIVDTAFSFIKDKIQQVIDFLTPYIHQFLNWFKDTSVNVFNYLKDFWAEHGAWITDLFTSVWNGIKNMLSTTFKFIQQVATDIFNGLQSFWKKHGDTIKTIFKVAWDAIVTVVMGIWNRFKSQAESIFNALKSFWTTWGDDVKRGFDLLWNTVLAVVKTHWNTISTVISVATDIILGIIDVFIKIFKGDWEGAWNSIKKTCSNVVDSICGLVNNIINAWRGIGDKIASFFSGIGNKIMAHFPSWLKTLINGGNPFSGMISRAVGSLNPFTRAIDDTGIYHMDMPDFNQSVLAISDTASTPYVTADSAESRAWNNAFNTTTSNYNYQNGMSQKIKSNDGKIIELLQQLVTGKSQPTVALNIENFHNERETDIQQIMKEISYYMNQQLKF